MKLPPTTPPHTCRVLKSFCQIWFLLRGRRFAALSRRSSRCGRVFVTTTRAEGFDPLRSKRRVFLPLAFPGKINEKEKRLPAPWWNSCRLSVQGTFHQPLCGLDERPAWVYTLNPWSIIILIYTRWTAVSSATVNGNQSIFDFGAKKKVPWPVHGVFLTAGITFSPPPAILIRPTWCYQWMDDVLRLWLQVIQDWRLRVRRSTQHWSTVILAFRCFGIHPAPLPIFWERMWKALGRSQIKSFALIWHFSPWHLWALSCRHDRTETKPG